MKTPRSSGLPVTSLWVAAAVVGWWGMLAAGWHQVEVKSQWTIHLYLLVALGVPLLFAGVAWLYGWSLRRVRRGPPGSD